MAKGKRAGRAYVEIYADNNKLTKGLKQASAKLKAFSARVGAIGAGMTAIGGGMLLALKSAGNTFARVGDQLDKMSNRTGLAVDWLSKMDYVASQTGSSLETVEKSVAKMQKTINDAGRGLSTQTEALEKLNLNYEQLKSLSPEEQFEILGNAIANLDTDTEKTAIAMDIFGKAGTKLLPMFKSGADGMNAMSKQAEKLGLILSKEDAKSAADLTDAMDRLGRAFMMIKIQVGGALAPTLTKLSDAFAKIGADASKFIKANKALVVSVAGGVVALTAMGTALMGIAGITAIVGGAVAGLGAIVSAVVGIVGAIGAPVAIAVAVLAGLGVAFVSIMAQSEGVQKSFGKLKDSALNNFGIIGDSFKEMIGAIGGALQRGDIELAGKIAMEGLKLNVKRVLNEIIRLFGETRNIIKQYIGEWLLDMNPAVKALKMIGVISSEQIKNFTADMVELSNELEGLITGDKQTEFFNTYNDEEKLNKLLILEKELSELEAKKKGVAKKATEKKEGSSFVDIQSEADAKIQAEKQKQEKILAIEKEFAKKREALRKKHAKEDKQERRDEEDSNLRKGQQEELKRLEEYQANEKKSLEERHQAEKKRLEDRFEEKYGVSSQGNIKQAVSKEKRVEIKQRAFSIQGARQARETSELASGQVSNKDELLNKQSQARQNVSSDRYASDSKAQNRANEFTSLEAERQSAISAMTPEMLVQGIVQGMQAVKTIETTAKQADKSRSDIWQKNIIEIEKTLKEHTRIFQEIEVNTGMLTVEGI